MKQKADEAGLERPELQTTDFPQQATRRLTYATARCDNTV